MASMVAIDLGAQSGRVARGRFDGDRLEVEELHRFPNDPRPTGDRLTWDVRGLYRETLAGLRAAARDGAEVDSIGVDSWAVDFGLVDAHGELVGDPVSYRDARRAAAFDGALATVPARELYARTGIQIIPINTIFELAALAVAGDPALDAAATLLLIPDLVNSWLAGTRVAEHTNATTTQCLDAATGGWADDLLERLGIPVGLFPDVVQPGTVLGGLVPGVAGETGLGTARVVAVASHDTASAVAAIPLRDAGSVYISAGTWSLVGVEVDAPLIDDATFAANLTNEGGFAGTTRLLRNVAGLWLLHECRRAWAAAGTSYTFEQLVELAAAAPALVSFVEPNDPVFAAPGDMPARIRDFCSATGQPQPVEPGAVARCILESLALKHAQTVGLLGAVTGVAAQEIHMVGGGARNALLCRWTADAAGLPVVAGPEEATLLGNLLVQAIALGEIGSLAEAREVVARSFAPVTYEPEQSAAWDDARERFAALTRPSAAATGVAA